MWMPPAERTRLARRMPLQVRCIFELGISTGLRVSEILNLEWGFSAPRARGMSLLAIPRELIKGKARGRVINIPSHVQRLLRRLPEHKGERIFQMTRNTVYRLLRKHAHIRPHDMRRIFATDVYNATGDVILTSVVLGHHDYRNTLLYIHNRGAKDLWPQVHRYQQRQRLSSRSAAFGSRKTKTGNISAGAPARSATTYSPTAKRKATKSRISSSSSARDNAKRKRKVS